MVYALQLVEDKSTLLPIKYELSDPEGCQRSKKCLITFKNKQYILQSNSWDDIKVKALQDIEHVYKENKGMERSVHTGVTGVQVLIFDLRYGDCLKNHIEIAWTI